MEKRIIELEKRIAFQEQEIRELRDALMQQHKEIEALNKAVMGLKDRMEKGSLVRDIKDEEPPPHY